MSCPWHPGPTDAAAGTRPQRPVPACTTASSSPSSSNAVCTARAAACTLSARVTTEMRISLVEIISMLMPASYRASKSRADTPAADRIALPTSESLPIWSSYCREVKPMASCEFDSAVSARSPSDFGRVNEMSVRPSAPETFCTAFRAFADAQSTYVAAPDDAVAEQALVDAADELLGLGQPLGLSEGGLVSLQQLVDGSLSQAGDPTFEADDVTPDPAALDTYLAVSCPA